MRAMSEEEHEKLVEVGNSFWEKFSQLCAEHIEQMPVDLMDVTTCYLGEKTSIYGSNYEKYLKDPEHIREHKELYDVRKFMNNH